MFVSVSASGATPLSQRLLSTKAVPGLTKYYLAPAETRSCPESIFRKPTTPASAREILANRSSETLFLEKITTSKNPKSVYDTALAGLTKCRTTGVTSDGKVTSAKTRAVNLGHFSVPVRAYTVSFSVKGDDVAGVIAYATKGPSVIALGEVSLTTLNVRVFKVLLTKALAKA